MLDLATLFAGPPATTLIGGFGTGVIENFRPGTLEKWDLGWEELTAAGPRPVLARVTAFVQFGPARTAPASARSPRR
ncbi:hypothetical protein AV521_21805 [Streptomyces sp. IMTB 2501]|nr:hypothetical protein AV521_21805 [Streptomyces sp. IMTB 2501]